MVVRCLILPIFCSLLFALASRVVASGAGNDWMSSLDGDLPLSQLSIPGTHDSGARFEPFPGTAICQNLTIGEQLAIGVRFLDIRCRHLNDSFTIHHGQVYQNINFTDVLTDVLAFLDANPGETVIMSVKQEYQASGNTRSFEATFDSYVAQNPGRWKLGWEVPTLDEARGKIVLFRRFGASSTPKGINASVWPDNTSFNQTGRLRVQDRYVVPSNDDKWSAVEALLDEAGFGGADTLYVNFSSGYKSGLFGIPSIPTVSDFMNPKLETYFTENPSGRFGVVVMDFVDATRAELIYRTNDPVGRPVAHPAYFHLVNRHSGMAMDLSGVNRNEGAAINQWPLTVTAPNHRWALATTPGGEAFRIQSWVSSKCASIEGGSTVAGARLVCRDDLGDHPSQQFALEDAGDGYFKLRNEGSDLVLEVENASLANNAKIQQNTDTNGHHQHWRLLPWGDYHIRTSSGKYLGLKDGENALGTSIVQQAWSDSAPFRWRFIGGDTAALKAASLSALPRVIGVAPEESAPGTNTRLFAAESGETHGFHLIPQPNGTFRFKFVGSGLSWGIPAGQSGDGAPLEQQTAVASANQEFGLERVVGSPVILIPTTRLDVETDTVTLSWETQVGFQYQPQKSADLSGWNDLTASPLPGNGLQGQITDNASSSRMFYRVVVTPES